jgi:hypothetical protein
MTGARQAIVAAAGIRPRNGDALALAAGEVAAAFVETVPNQLGVAYNAHVIEAILTHVAPALGWR